MTHPHQWVTLWFRNPPQRITHNGPNTRSQSKMNTDQILDIPDACPICGRQLAGNESICPKCGHCVICQRPKNRTQNLISRCRAGGPAVATFKLKPSERNRLCNTEATVSSTAFKDVASIIKTSFHWVAHIVWATLCFFRPLEIRRTLGIELFLMNDHNVIVMPVKSCREHGPSARGLGG